MHKEGAPKSGLKTRDVIRTPWIEDRKNLRKEIETVPLQAQPEDPSAKRSFANGRSKNRLKHFAIGGGRIVS